MLESQITLKLLTKSMSFSPSKRIIKVLNKGKWIEVGEVIYNRRNYKSIKIKEDSIEQKLLENGFKLKIEKTALKKSQRLYK